MPSSYRKVHKMVPFNNMLTIVTVFIFSNSHIVEARSFYPNNDSSDPENMTSTMKCDDSLESKHFQLLCVNSSYNCHWQITCTDSGPLLPPGYCATYNEKTEFLSLAVCPYTQPNAFNMSPSGQIVLPRNLSQLNDYMCGPMHRKGIVCSECADGFGPSVTTFGYTECTRCTNEWYRVPLFLIYEFVPITVFYLIVLVFQISLASAPMPCFIMWSQLVIISFASNTNVNSSLYYTEHFDRKQGLESLEKILFSIYGIFNLDFLKYSILPPFCVSTKLGTIHIAFLEYLSVIYPMFLILLTWICVELHGRNFRPLVLLWKPFHRCFVCLRRRWDTKSDIIDAFITFFLLSYNKLIYQAMLFINVEYITNHDRSCSHQQLHSRFALEDTKYYPLFICVVSIISFVFIIVPPFLLLLYPSRTFQSCLTKCRINCIALNTFIEKLYGCYRNGLDGGRDMRRFASLYFFLRIFCYLAGFLARYIDHKISKWYFVGTLILFTSLIFAVVKPYRKPIMNYLDILLLTNLTLVCYTLSLRSESVIKGTRILFAVPMLLLICKIILRKICEMKTFMLKCYTKFWFQLQKIVKYSRVSSNSELTQVQESSETVNSLKEDCPLISSSREVPRCYGAASNESVYY